MEGHEVIGRIRRLGKQAHDFNMVKAALLVAAVVVVQALGVWQSRHSDLAESTVQMPRLIPALFVNCDEPASKPPLI